MLTGLKVRYLTYKRVFYKPEPEQRGNTCPFYICQIIMFDPRVMVINESINQSHYGENV